jgi:hypothetical protein
MAKTVVPTLDISTLSEDAPIMIDGARHGVKHPDNLSLVDYKQLETDLPRLGHLMVKAKLSKEEGKEAKALLVGVIAVILDAPDATKAKLRDAQRVAILDVFTKLRSAAPATLMNAARRTTAGRRIGANSFPR